MSQVGDYALGYNDSESLRLDRQHNAIITAFGYILHPSIRSQLKPDALIAEVAAGTGIWLRDLAATLPGTTTFHAFDVSDAAYPVNRTEPSNVHYHVADAKKPFPTEFRGLFDVVHIRLISPGVQPGEWSGVLDNVRALLKPGGVIQWSEPDMRGIKHILRGSAAPDDPDYLNAVTAAWDQWMTPHLLEMVEKGGWIELDREMMSRTWKKLLLDAVSTDRVEEARMPVSYAFAEGTRRIAAYSASIDNSMSLEERMRKADLVKKALDKGAYLRVTFYTYLAWI